MKKRKWLSKGILLFILILLVLYFISVPKMLLFYDAPEYVNIAEHSSFFRSLSLGHQPLHPFFLAGLWLGVRALTHLFSITYEYAGNLTVFLFFAASLPFVYLIGKEIKLDKERSFLLLSASLLFPATFMVATGLMVETIMYFFFVAACFFNLKYLKTSGKKDAFLLVIFLLFLTGSHVIGIFWALIVFLLPFLFDYKNRKKDILTRIIVFIVPLAVGLTFIFLLTKSKGVDQTGFFLNYYLRQNFSFYGVLRALRNAWASYASGYGALTVLIVVFILLRNGGGKNNIFKIVLIFLIFFLGSTWSGDFMPKRVIFASLIFPLLLTRFLGKKALILLSLYLFPLFVSNLLPYLKPETKFPLGEVGSQANTLPAGGLLLETHYLRPFFNKYDGNYFWVGQDDLANIDTYLSSGKRVFVDSQAAFAPYLLYVGNNLHITSLGKFGDSETKSLFGKYVFDLIGIGDIKNRVFAYELKKSKLSFEERIKINMSVRKDSQALIIGQEKPGSAVYLYDRSLAKRIHRQRVDYGDLLTWVWVMVSDRKEPLLWTYADRDGIFILPVEKGTIGKISVKGSNQKDIPFTIY